MITKKESLRIKEDYENYCQEKANSLEKMIDTILSSERNLNQDGYLGSFGLKSQGLDRIQQILTNRYLTPESGWTDLRFLRELNIGHFFIGIYIK